MRTGQLGVSVTLALTLIAASAAQSRFTLKVHSGRGQVGYDVNSTMIIGERDMLVIDPQFSLSEAHKLAAEILESKKRLVTIYSTHAHPDHLFGRMKKYMADWDANVSRSKDAAGMRANVLEQYPGLGMEFTLTDRVATYFPAKPAQGQ